MNKTKKLTMPQSVIKSILIFLIILFGLTATLSMNIDKIDCSIASYIMAGICTAAAMISVMLNKQEQGREFVHYLIFAGSMIIIIVIMSVITGGIENKSGVAVNILCILLGGLFGVMLKTRIQRVKKSNQKKKKYR